MIVPQRTDSVRKICLLVVAAVLLPGLALAGLDNGKGNSGQNDGKQYGHHDDDKVLGQTPGKALSNDRDKVPSTPEPISGWVLLPVAGAVLLLSWRQLRRAKA